MKMLICFCPKGSMEKPINRSSEKWASIIKPFNRRNIDEPTMNIWPEELARYGLSIPNVAKQ